MDNKDKVERFRNLSYEDFKALAKDQSLSKYEKIGFPDEYRKGKEIKIFDDIISKLSLTEDNFNSTILDIGPGCSDLPQYIIDYCQKQNHRLLLVDSKEMLDLLPTSPEIIKYQGYFPADVPELLRLYDGKVDYIIGYSIFHYVFYNTCIFKFIDAALSLLRPGGKLFLGDIPNVSMRKRFFSTPAGVAFHQKYTNTNSLPEVMHYQLEPNHIDDGVLFGIMQRYRGYGFQTYLLPQNENLPMYNRREDLLISKF